MPFFSIIIPTYNRAKFITTSVRSALAQTYTDFEVIVVDDGSTDHTEEVVKNINDSRFSYYKKKNGERGAARNFGIEKATGKYITFLDSDDVLYKNYLSNAFESITQFKYPVFFHLGYEITDENLRSKSKVNYLKSDDIRILVKGNPLSCMGVFFKREIFPRFKFNEDRNLAGSEDWELWLRIAANFGIKTDNRISAALIDHTCRSVVSYNESQLLRRKELALHYAFMDKAVQEKFSASYKQMVAFCDSYIALHLVLSRNHKSGLKYLKSAFLHYPFCIFQRRSAAIAKHLLLNSIS